MHELAVAQAILDTCAEGAEGERVLRITIEIGTLCCVEPKTLTSCFAAAAVGSPLAGAKLHIMRAFARSRCRECGAIVQMENPLTRCRCGSANLDPPQGGDPVLLRSMELEQDALEALRVHDRRELH